MAKTKKLKVANPDELPPIAVIGTTRWKASVPAHLQAPLAKALHAMEANDIPMACYWFGECMQLCGDNWSHARPIFFFGAQVTGQRWLELRGAVPDHPHIKEWKEITDTILSTAVQLFPDDPVVRHNHARFLQDTGRLEEAKQGYRRAIMLDPGLVESYGNLFDIYYNLGDRDFAMKCGQKATELPADKASARLSQAYYWLRTGNYEKGWAAFNDRWKDLVFARGYGRDKELGGIHWAGETLNPKKHRLLLHGEQGLGDHIQFARYIPRLQDRGIVIAGLETRSVLQRWMEASFPDVAVYARDVDPLPHFTHHCSTMDLPGILGTTVETVPPPVAPVVWPEYTNGAALDRNKRVGIAWEGAKGNTADNIRSVPHEALRHLADIPGVTWVSLQFGENAALVGRSWLGKGFIDGTTGCTDFLDTAAVMRGLDLIVTVDTATLHCAGTLGVPTWALQRYASEWRWGLDAPTIPAWYPSVRHWSPTTPNGWEELLLRVRRELEVLCGTR